MEVIKDQLITIFDEMFGKLDKFNRLNYNDVFLPSFKKYESFIENISNSCEELSEEKRREFIEEIAFVLPSYVKEHLSKFKKREKNKIEMNYNMNMAGYIIPLLTYSNDVHLVNISNRMVEIWNEQKVTSLTLGYSTYEDIVKGFQYRLCYITTAVCEHQNKADDCYELQTLRKYRDEYLLKTEDGQKIVDEYYDIAPGLVMVMNMQQNADEIYEHIYQDYLSPCIHYIEEDKNEECRNLYMQMVRNLQKKYLYS